MKKPKLNVFLKVILLGISLINFLNTNAQNVNSTTATTGLVPVWTNGGTFEIGNSQIQDNGSEVGIGMAPGGGLRLSVNGIINSAAYFSIGGLSFLRGDLFSSVWVGDNISTAGSNNTIVGSSAGANNIQDGNTLMGSFAGFSGSSGSFYYNTAVGCSALYTSQRYGGTAVGYMAAVNCTTGCGITAIGENALFNNTTGSYNVAVGRHSGRNLYTGSYNTFLGDFASVPLGCVPCTSITHATAIGAGAKVLNSYEMILGNNSEYVGIGYSGASAYPPGKLSVDENAGDVSAPTIAGFFHNGDVQSDAQSPFDKTGIFVNCDGLFKNSSGGWVVNNIGGDFYASNAEEFNIAVRGTVTRGADDDPGFTGIGGYFESRNFAHDNIGVWAESDGTGQYTNYGIYAKAPRGVCSNSGPCYDAAGFFNGDVYTMNTYFSSDANLKDNIQPIPNGSSILMALHPKKFTFRTTQFPYLNLPAGDQDGLIAQEVQNILPHLVSSFKVPVRLDSIGNIDTSGINTPFLAVNYVGIIPYLIEGFQEQQHNIDSLNNVIDTLRIKDSLMSARMDNLEQLINNCCSSSGSSNRVRNPIDVELGSESIILNQNDPNPFAEQTHITFTVPENVKEAKIIFFDNSGHVMQTVIINERGNGQLNVYGEKLSSGIYSYSLIADGKVIDTKKMVCNK